MTETMAQEDRRANMLFGGIWLVFLISPAIALVRTDAAVIWQVVGWVATILFAVGYLISYLHPTPGPLNALSGAAAWSIVLAALAACTIPAVEAYALTFVAFLVAIPVFRLPAPWDAVGGFVPVVVTIAVIVALGWPSYLGWQIWLTPLPLVLMLPLRRIADGMERQSELRHELDLSRQRERVGRDVHDILGHSLTVIAVKTELASKLVDRDPDRARTELEDVLELARSSLGEVRTTVTQLQTPSLSSQLIAAGTALKAAGIRVERPTQIPNVNDSASHLLAWCLREAITNVVRHSDASLCSITISETGLTVTDDGAGLAEVAEGHGLRGMRKRITDAGGTMVLREADPGAPRPGTHLEVSL